METPATNNSKRPIVCTTIVHNGDNNELVFIRSYRGDWGHWDDKIEKCTSEVSIDELKISENELPEIQ
ncbi:hypothetical protein ACFS3A_08665 [Flavobacterium notoginsengisoli]